MLQVPKTKNFNPRSHERSDQKVAFIGCHVIQFQSTLPREERLSVQTLLPPTPLFQSTLPREERRFQPTVNSRLHLYFNPRSHERSDPFQVSIEACHMISIHAPTRGATLAYISVKSCFGFQSTLPREERLQPTVNSRLHLYFNPRSHERSDLATLL